MNTQDFTSHSADRPFGFWITAVDRLMAAEFARAFENEGVSRREWRLLNVVDGTVPSDRPLSASKLRRLVELGWVASDGDGWTLTDEGRGAKERLDALVAGIRARIAGAVEPDEFAAMASTLEKIARELGWQEGMRLPRRPGRTHRHGEHRHGEHRHDDRHQDRHDDGQDDRARRAFRAVLREMRRHTDFGHGRPADPHHTDPTHAGFGRRPHGDHGTERFDRFPGADRFGPADRFDRQECDGPRGGHGHDGRRGRHSHHGRPSHGGHGRSGATHIHLHLGER